MAYAQDLGSCGLRPVWVRLPPGAREASSRHAGGAFYFFFFLRRKTRRLRLFFSNSDRMSGAARLMMSSASSRSASTSLPWGSASGGLAEAPRLPYCHPASQRRFSNFGQSSGQRQGASGARSRRHFRTVSPLG